MIKNKTGILKLFSYQQTILLLLAIIFNQNTNAQLGNLRFSHLSIENGLPQNTVHGIVQDKYDFMWFGTWSGLCRFDGYKFTYFIADPKNPHSIPNGRIYMLYKDGNQDIWIGTNDSTIITRYNYETDDFTNFNYKEVQPSLLDSINRRTNYSHTHVNTIKTKWEVHPDISTLVETDCKTRKQYIYKADPLNRWALSDNDATNIYLDANNILWVGTYSGGINKANTLMKPFYYYYHTFKDENGIIDNNIRGIGEDQNGNLWVGSRSMGITKIDRINNKYKSYQSNEKDTIKGLIDNQIRSIYCDRYGFIWIGTKNGLNRFNSLKNKFYHYSTSIKNKTPDNWIYSIIEDHYNNLWIGTWKGLAKYDRKNDRFLIYDSAPILKSPMVRFILEDRENNFWIATSGGGITCLKHEISEDYEDKLLPIHQYLYEQNDSNSISSNLVYALFEDENGIIWAGTNSGLNRIDTQTNTIRRFMLGDGLPDETILGLLGDNNGYLWMSHRKGISRFDTKTFTFRNYTIFDGLQGVEFNENAFYRSSKTGEMFFGGVNGLNAFFPDSIKENKTYLPKVVISDFRILNSSVPINKEINDHVVLTKPIYMTEELTLTHKDKSISLEFAALLYANPQSNKYAHMLEGFDQDWIYTDASNRTATYSNLSPKTYFFKVKGSNSDGIWNPEPTVLKIIVLPPWWGTWWFRLIAFISITSIIIGAFYSRVQHFKNQKILLENLVEKKTSELREMNSMLIKQAEELNLTNLKLEERQEQIEHQSEELSVQKESLLKMNNDLNELNATKDKFFSIIAHDIKNPFNAILGFTELLKENFKDWTDDMKLDIINLVLSSSKNLYQLLENLLHWSRSQRGIIEFKPQKIELKDLLNNPIELLKGTAEAKNIELSYAITNNELEVIADRQMIETIIRNLLSNAIKFTSTGGKVHVSAEKMDDCFIKIKVTDNGVGIRSDIIEKLFHIESNCTTPGTANETGTGLGLILVKEFVKRHGGEINVESTVGEGSTFYFTLPLAK